MSDNAFCHNCGAQLPPNSSFCPRCGTRVPLGTSPPSPSPSPPPQEPQGYYGRRERKRHEKYEKQEKHEKNEKGGGSVLGPVVGGLILVWLGVTFYLQQLGTIPSDNWWAYFLVGIGVILVIQGLIIYSQRHRTIFGPIIGGVILIIIGLSAVYGNVKNFWPLILVVIGVAILVSALARNRTPRPV